MELRVSSEDREAPEDAADLETAKLPCIRSVESFSGRKLFQDMQERLLVMSHYRLQQTLDTAPSMTQNSISKLLLAVEEQPSGAKVHVADPEA